MTGIQMACPWRREGGEAAPGAGLVSLTNKSELVLPVQGKSVPYGVDNTSNRITMGPLFLGDSHAFGPLKVQPPVAGGPTCRVRGTSRRHGDIAQRVGRHGASQLSAVRTSNLPPVNHGDRDAPCVDAGRSGTASPSTQVHPASEGTPAALGSCSRRQGWAQRALPMRLRCEMETMLRGGQVSAWTLGGSTDPEGVATFGFGPEHAARAAAEMYALARTDSTYRDASQFRATLVDLFAQVLARLPEPRRGGVQ